jgi:hypothetical protein
MVVLTQPGAVRMHLTSHRMAGLTQSLVGPYRSACRFNPRPAWEATQAVMPCAQAVVVSIHAPRVGSDLKGLEPLTCGLGFNPRSPCGERQAIETTLLCR